jgi:hypothetical protein
MQLLLSSMFNKNIDCIKFEDIYYGDDLIE